MAEREPDVIERMYRAYINSDVVGPEAMLAAVRELQIILKDHDRISAVADLRDIIADHERRAGGKGE